MARLRPLFALTLLLPAAATTATAAPPEGVLAGRVTADSGPLASSSVYAYGLADLDLTQVITDTTGRFLFEELPAGLYKIIAFKPGFVPAVVRLARGSAAVNQFLEVQLDAAPAGSENGNDFWSLREQIPPDVLRELLLPRAQEAARGGPLMEMEIKPRLVGPVRGSMAVLTGREEGPGGNSPLTHGRIDLATQVHDLTFGLSGDVRMLGQTDVTRGAVPQPVGASNAFALKVHSEGDTAVVVSSRRDRLDAAAGGVPVDMHNVQVHWSQPIGSEGQSEFIARYTEEQNFYRRGLLTKLTLPEGSQSWFFEGNYTTPLTERSTMQAGVRYRDHEAVDDPRFLSSSAPLLAESRVDLYGMGGLRLTPETLLEYGVVSSLEDGQLAFAPRAGAMFDLGNRWQTSAVASHKVNRTDPLASSGFVATHFEELNGCDQVHRYCYQIAISRETESGEGFSLAATDRQFDEAVRLYFDEDFFRHLDSLYVVDGDRLPEVRFTLTRRLAPQVLARLTTTSGSGGGGEASTWSWKRYENDVQFLVTSIETRFERTNTGVVLSFQQLSQQLQPLSGAGLTRHGEVERLQLMFDQDLNALLNLAAQWALQLDVEVSRGDLNQIRNVDASELYRRFTGGIAVRF